MAAPARKLNKLAASVAKLTGPLPEGYKPWGYTLAFDGMVRACVCAAGGRAALRWGGGHGR